MNDAHYFKERICYECKKKFLPAPYHIYRDERKWFCKWTCYNAYKKRQEQGEEKKGSKK